MDLSKFNMDQLAEWYKRTEAAIEEIEKSKEGPKTFLKELADMILRRLQESGATAIATPHGTVHTVGRTTARVLDPVLFEDFVAKNGWDYLDLKANMTACRSYMEKTKTPIPGVELNTYRYLSITAPKPKKANPDVD